MPSLRDALAARLDEADEKVRGEAIRGLAVRNDARVIPAIVAVLADRDDVEHYRRQSTRG